MTLASAMELGLLVTFFLDRTRPLPLAEVLGIPGERTKPELVAGVAEIGLQQVLRCKDAQ